jgi:hypothetical protein
MNIRRVFMDGVIFNNPTFVQVIGMCPTLAVSNSAVNGFLMIILATVSCAMLCPDAPKTLTPIKLKYFLKNLYIIHIKSVLTKAPDMLYTVEIMTPDATPPIKLLNRLTARAYFIPYIANVISPTILASPSFAPGAKAVKGLGIVDSIIWSPNPTEVSMAKCIIFFMFIVVYTLPLKQ